MFGIPEDKAVQEPDEGEVLERVSCVLNKLSLEVLQMKMS